MLEPRPTCENCNKPLPAASAEARICTYECTFCAACVGRGRAAHARFAATLKTIPPHQR